MRTKSAYREPVRKNLAAEPANIPEENPQPSETTQIEVIDKAHPDKGTIAAIDTAIPEPPDEATVALQRQLDALKKSEELQRMAAHAQAHAQPPTREQLLQAWRSQGADEGDLAFLESNPELID